MGGSVLSKGILVADCLSFHISNHTPLLLMRKCQAKKPDFLASCWCCRSDRQIPNLAGEQSSYRQRQPETLTVTALEGSCNQMAQLLNALLGIMVA